MAQDASKDEKLKESQRAFEKRETNAQQEEDKEKTREIEQGKKRSGAL